MASSTCPSPNAWDHFNHWHLRYPSLGFSMDCSRMALAEGFLEGMQAAAETALSDMRALEAGAIANPDEGRMVGHYWLRNPGLAPSGLAEVINATLEQSLSLAASIREGRLCAANGRPFTRVLVVGIGGSALGPQLLADALTPARLPLAVDFFDNTDPDGIQRILERIGEELATTLTVVISKSGGTKETRNGMLEAEAAYKAEGIAFSRHAVAVTGEGSELDRHATSQQWLARLPMWDWVGGRTSLMSTVGTLVADLIGVDVRGLLRGAAAMDQETRSRPPAENAAMLLALMWHSAGQGRGLKDMVVLPYKDRLMLFSKYLQQLVMESLGKEHDLQGRVVNQGLAVYGNKGSTDQHAYVQQLRDGVDNFFVTFIEVLRSSEGRGLQVDPGLDSGDYLQGFLRGTRRALSEKGRQSITLSLEQFDAFGLGMLIALFERAVGFYASIVGVNAYHQPGVEAGKLAAGTFLKRLLAVEAWLPTQPASAGEAAKALGLEDIEEVWCILRHLAANGRACLQAGLTPKQDRFNRAS
jgi:glucose-6-phosphate isomerase